MCNNQHNKMLPDSDLSVSDKTEHETCQKQCNIILAEISICKYLSHSLESFVQESDYTYHAIGI